MMHARPATLFLAILLLLPAVAPAANPSPRLATMDELRQMYDAGHFQVCLQQIARVSRLTGDAAKPYDRWALMLLKADCLLRLEDSAEALRTYRAAEASPVPKQAAEARAMDLLIQRSEQLAYRPKSRQVAEAYAITTPESRRKAMAALFEDELAVRQPLINQALEASNLQPILDVVQPLVTLWALETTATGKEDKSGPLLSGVGERARTLIDRDLQIRTAQLDGIRQRANQLVESTGVYWWQDGVTRRGLYTPDRKELRDLMAYVQKVEDVSLLGQRYSWQLGRDGRKWDHIITDCKVLIAETEKVLEAN